MMMTSLAGSSAPVDASGMLGSVSPLCMPFGVSARSGSITGEDEAVATDADWDESASDWDPRSLVGVCEEDTEQLATASAHVPTPARMAAGFFMGIAHSFAFTGNQNSCDSTAVSADTSNIPQDNSRRALRSNTPTTAPSHG